MNCNTIPKLRSAFLNDRAVKLKTATLYGFSDSVLCPGKITEYPRQTLGRTKLSGSRSFLNIVNWILSMENQSCSSGTNSQDTQHCSYFGKSKERWRTIQFCMKSSKIESSSCRCTTTSIGEKQKNKEKSMSSSLSVAAYTTRFPRGHWSFLRR